MGPASLGGRVRWARHPYKLQSHHAASDKQIVLNCANCGAPVQVDREDGVLVCRHCGSSEPSSPIAQHVEVVSSTDKACPSCTTPLVRSRLDGQPFLFCQRCEGMLIEMEYFVSVIDAARAHERPGTIPPRRQSPGDRTLKCPECTRPMLSHFYGGPGNLVLDTCEGCHLNWLDPGELRRIARARS